MPTETDVTSHDPSRRRFVAAIGALPFVPPYALAKTREDATLAAAWDDEGGKHFVGRICVGEPEVRVLDCLEVPTRAHGVACAADGSVLAAARRPGDWMLRWRPGAGPRWHWADDDRRFCGHLLLALDEARVYTTEFDLDSGQGRLVCRDAMSLKESEAWPTHGRDPHDLEWLGDGTLLVANGGLETLPESGRTKHNLEQMDSSLVRVDAQTGALMGQWRLPDRRLSLRHLARHASGKVGIALQAEHDAPADRAAAPLFAIFDPETQRLELRPAVRTGNGYAGDIASTRNGWLVSCPKDDQFILVPHGADSAVRYAIAQGCAIAVAGATERALVLGNAALLEVRWPETTSRPGMTLRFDNHATFLPDP
jgi:hypothetical protein